jgi:hypothetical protein
MVSEGTRGRGCEGRKRAFSHHADTLIVPPIGGHTLRGMRRVGPQPVRLRLIHVVYFLDIGEMNPVASGDREPRFPRRRMAD